LLAFPLELSERAAQYWSLAESLVEQLSRGGSLLLEEGVKVDLEEVRLCISFCRFVCFSEPVNLCLGVA